MTRWRERKRLAGELVAARVAPRAVDFARAVVLQLLGTGAADAEPSRGDLVAAADRVAGALALAEGDLPAALLAPLLLRDPPLLAAIFQNLDLLYAAGYLRADRLSLLLAEAVELDAGAAAPREPPTEGA